MMSMFYYVYLLRNTVDESWYIGFTRDINQRVKDHNDGRGGKTTRQKKMWNLIYFEGYKNKADAIGREKFLKSGSGRRFLKKQIRYFLSMAV